MAQQKTKKQKLTVHNGRGGWKYMPLYQTQPEVDGKVKWMATPEHVHLFYKYFIYSFFLSIALLCTVYACKTYWGTRIFNSVIIFNFSSKIRPLLGKPFCINLFKFQNISTWSVIEAVPLKGWVRRTNFFQFFFDDSDLEMIEMCKKSSLSIGT